MRDDEVAEFARTRGALEVCALQKALLARCCDCRLAQRVAIAEREVIRCTRGDARERCARWRTHLRSAAAFVLRLTAAQAPLPHAAELKLQCGGLRGLQATLQRGEDPPQDVDALLAEAELRFGAMDAWPAAELVRAVAAYQPRRRVK